MNAVLGENRNIRIISKSVKNFMNFAMDFIIIQIVVSASITLSSEENVSLVS